MGEQPSGHAFYALAIALSVWGPPTDATPEAAGNHDFNSVHPEGDNGGPTAGGLADDLCPILTPREMLAPLLLAWIE